MGMNAVATLWSIAEACLFFIVPDVWLSYVARHELRRGLIACGYALVGALVGGSLMYLWGRQAPEAALAAVVMVPAVSLDMTLRVGEALNEEGVMAVLLGPLTGTPYKVYAVQAFHAGIGPGEFLLISVPARLVRFLLVTVISHHVVAWLSRWHPFRSRGRVLLIAWLMFYALFFLLMPW